ncbi:MAG: hypothetical protein WC414_03080 [Patescibacteria group bacterium]
MRKLFFLFLSIFSFLPLSVGAVNLDTNHCWEKQKCITYREQTFYLTTNEAKEGFKITSESMLICDTDEKGKSNKFDGEFGFCLASSAATTNISIAGRNDFTDLTDFISYIYKYAFAAASIVAIIIIIIAGIQWIISGGESNAISEAKKKIAGASIGLILLALSYSILYTINPYLVNFRPMNIYMVNEDYYAPYCSQLKDKNTSLYTSPATSANKSESVSSSRAICGKNYYVGAGEKTCQGSYCEKAGTMCALAALNTTTPSCIEANITGKVVNNGFLYILSEIVDSVTFSEGWEWTWVNEPKIYYVCNDGTFNDLETKISETKEDNDLKVQIYKTGLRNQKIDQNLCNKNKGLKGFLLAIEFNENGDASDEKHLVGITECNDANICVGVDMSDVSTSDIFNKVKTIDILKAAKEKYFIDEAELLKGITININVKNFQDIDDEDTERKFYEYLSR